MKRDLDLMRSLLIQAEEATFGNATDSDWRTFKSYEVPPDVVVYHARLLFEQGLLHSESINLKGQDSNGRTVAKFCPDVLTNAGHDFLDLIQNDTVWQKTKNKVAETTGRISLDAFAEVAKTIALRMIMDSVS